MVQILLADSDLSSRKKIVKKAKEKGYSVEEVSDGITALKLFKRKEYDVIILDSYLPELSGLNVCRMIRKTSDVPVIFVTAMSKEKDRLDGFDVGADDYIIKPFYVSELYCRIETIIAHHKKREERAVIHTDKISVHMYSRAVYVDDKKINLAPKEYDLLVYLMQNEGIALSREMILNNVWGQDFEGTDRTVDTHVRAIREHIAPYSDKVMTVWGIGYKFEN